MTEVKLLEDAAKDFRIGISQQDVGKCFYQN